MIAKGIILQIHKEQIKFSVPKNYGGMRPIINLKCHYTYVETVHFKMEGTHMLKIPLRLRDTAEGVVLRADFTICY